jgi:hypothetical protein
MLQDLMAPVIGLEHHKLPILEYSLFGIVVAQIQPLGPLTFRPLQMEQLGPQEGL